MTGRTDISFPATQEEECWLIGVGVSIGLIESESASLAVVEN